MRDLFLEAKITELIRLREADLLPFPYNDCRRLREARIGRQKRYQDLIPDLDVYFSWVSGSCSWGGKILEWPQERMRRSLKLSQASFFEWFPIYKPLKLQVVKWRYAELDREFKKHNEMKRLLTEILAYLLAERALSEIEVTVQKKEPHNLFRLPAPSRAVRLAHRLARRRVARQERERSRRPVKFSGPALRVVSIKPLGEYIF